MQRQTNELEILIGEAFRRGEPAFLGYALSIIYLKPDLKHSIVTRADIEKLNKLANKADSVATYFIAGLTYDLILTNRLLDIAALKADILLVMANSLLAVLENTKGTFLAGQIGRYIRALSKAISERTDLSPEEHSLLNTLLKVETLKNSTVLNNTDEHEEITEIIRLSKSKGLQDKAAGIIKMIDLLCNCPSLQDQIEVFGRKMLNIFTFVLSGTNESCGDLFEILATFIETMIFQADYIVQIDRKCLEPGTTLEKNPELFVNMVFDNIEKPQSSIEVLNGGKNSPESNSSSKIPIKYSLVEPHAMIKEVDGVYAAVSFVLNILILYPKISKVQLICLRLLERLHHYYPVHQKKSEELLLMFFSKIDPNTAEDVKKAAAILLYKLINRDASEAFKAVIETRENLDILFNSPDYNSAALNDLEIVDLPDIHLKAGFPFSRTIEASNAKSEYIEVWQPGSIISLGFVILQHDVTLSIERVARFKHVMAREKDEPYTLVKNFKIDSAKRPVRGNILIKEPGIYRIQIDNKTSWFTSKTVRYRLLVLTPNFEQSPELKAMHEQLIEANWGQIYLPSQIFGPDIHVPLDSTGSRKSLDLQKTKSATSTRILIYINWKAVQVSIASKGKKDEAIFKHGPEGQVDWEKNNLRIQEFIKGTISDLKEGRLSIQIVYEEFFMEKQLKLEKSAPKFRETVESYFASHIPIISQILPMNETKPQILTEMEFQVQRLASNNTWFNSDTFIMFVIDHYTKVVQCKLRKETRETFDIDLGDFVIPVISEGSEGKQTIDLKPAEILLFDEDLTITQRIAYLAFLIHCIFCSSIRTIKDFVILEDTPVLADSKSFNRILLKEAIDSYYIKYKKSEIQEHSLDPLSPLNLHFCEQHRETNITL